MSTRYVDVHSHLQFEQYKHDEVEVVAKMREKGVESIVVGVDLASSRAALILAEKYAHLYAAIGLHPTHAGLEFFDEAEYHTLVAHPKVVAIGECGLDYFRPEEVNDEVKLKQKVLLREHIELAGATGKPLIIHCRPSKGTQDAYHDLIVILKEAKEKYHKLHGDIHFFVGVVKEAKELIALGFTVSFTAVITFARDYDEVIRTVPLKSILSETDAPYLAPLTRRGERNDPLTVIDVVEKIAEIRDEDLETVRMALLTNARRLFDI